MISIDRISIREFRGIRRLDLEFKRKNFGICGPNGTGKSGVVDAIDFGLTGSITRLMSTGTSDLNVTKHAPHVDATSTPEKSVVTIYGVLQSTGKPVTITRSVHEPKKPKIEPNDAATRAAITEIEQHPEFALSRREIAKYIITPPNRRAKDVQTLLRLDELEKIRGAIQSSSNKTEKISKSAKLEYDRAQLEFIEALKINDQTVESILSAVNERRRLLKIPPLSALEPDTLLTEGLNISQGINHTTKIQKKSAIEIVETILKEGNVENESNRTQRTRLRQELETLHKDVETYLAMKQHALVKQGIVLIEGDFCPLCDTKWMESELRDHLESKLLSADAAQRKLQALDAQVLTLRTCQVAWGKRLRKLLEFSTVLEYTEDRASLVSAIEDATELSKVLEKPLTDSENLLLYVDALNNEWCVLSREAKDWILGLKRSVEALPEPNKEDEARDYLVTAQANYGKSVAREKEAKEAKERSRIAQQVLKHFNESNTTTLNDIYDSVTSDFAEFYKKINEDDEAEFTGSLYSEPAKLNLKVDFYGRGEFPPGAFHSEGHQDGMGLCLYLALMKHTLGKRFKFCVLDDVLMSVDTSHRREVCRLLRAEFPKTQFIVTTHDQVWLLYMRTENLLQNVQKFDGWTVDLGPRVWDDLDVWNEIEQALTTSDVSKAAFFLRRYLEHICFTLCDGLQVSVRFRGDGQYALGALLNPALSHVAERLKLAEKAASSRGKEALSEEILRKRKEYKIAYAATQVEKWSVNSLVHYNEWANLTSTEFKTVVDAFKNVLSALQCETCSGFIYTTHAGFKENSMRCSCGELAYELVVKK